MGNQGLGLVSLQPTLTFTSALKDERPTVVLLLTCVRTGTTSKMVGDSL
jgi:hypothetical protein